MAEQGKSTATGPAHREVIITRVFDAPREVVFKAWTDPKQMAQWWGPKGFTNPICEVDARVGGAWHIVMRAPNGAEYPCGGVYREVVSPERLVFTNIAKDKDGIPVLDGLTTVLFAEEGGKTKLTVQTRAVAVVAYATTYLAGMEAGWTQSLERLEALVTSEKNNDMASTADREIVQTRIFDAPRELVFQMWTDPEHIVQWWGPNGFTTTIHEMDVRPGGVWRFIMHGPDGVDYQNKIVYNEIVKPERLVYDHVSGPRFHVTLIFAEQGGKTELTMRMLFDTAAERDNTIKKFGAIEGLNQHLGRLAAHLAKR